MLQSTNDLGAALYKTWTEKQRSDEIEKLVEGFRNGVPIGILCKMTEAIAGNRKIARKYLKQFMSAKERADEISAAAGGMRPLLKSFLS